MNYIFISITLLSIVLLFKKLQIRNVRKVLTYTLINTGYTVTMMGLAYILTRIIALLNGRPFKLTYLPLMKFEDIIFVTVIVLTFIGYVLSVRKFTSQFKEKNEFVLGSLIFLFILGLIVTFALPGGSYLMVIPALLIAITLLVKEFVKFDYTSYVMLIPIAFVVILFIPTIYLFNAALTIGGLAANMLFMMIAFISIVSSAVCIQGITK